MTPEQQALVESHMPVAQALAQQVYNTAPHALEVEELRAIAYLGLVGAAVRWHKYCAEREYDPGALQFFRPFVVQRVRGALYDALRASDWATRTLRTRAKALQAAGQDRGASHQQLAERTGMSLAEVRSTVRGMTQRPVSLEGEELDPGAEIDVESTVFTRSVLTRLVDTVRALPPDQQVVVALHYHRGLQLQQVAERMGVTDSRASQLHAKAVLAIHQAMVVAAAHKDDE